MNLLPKSEKNFASKEYWDDFFKKRGDKAFEWYGEYPELSKYLHKYLKHTDNILVVGCGNSTLSSDLFDTGFKQITSVDISQVVINKMQKLHAELRPLLKFVEMDASNMNFNNEHFSATIDKGTLDALLPDDNPDLTNKAIRYLSEIDRVMKLNGRYLCVSLLQNQVLEVLLNYFPKNEWMIRIVRCFEAEKTSAERGQTVFPVFIVICTKMKVLTKQVMEVNMLENEKILRCENKEEVLNYVLNVQRNFFLSNKLKNSFSSEYSEYPIELFSLDGISLRYKTFIVNLPYDKKRGQYAAFIVPQGREVEWMFLTSNGRKHLTEISYYNRLIIVTLCRDQNYVSLESITTELENAVLNFAPKNFKGKIPFLSLGSDIGKRVRKFKGESKFSGEYVVEDVQIDGEIFRRLIFLKCQNMIQTEVKLIKKKNNKEIIDHHHLASKYHLYLALGCNFDHECKVLVVGLGGGSLCMFLHNFLPQSSITAVDLDPDVIDLGKKWFGLKEGSRLKLIADDGLRLLSESRKRGERYDSVIIDVDNKDTNLGISCPPEDFLKNNVIEDVVNCLNTDGVLLLNLVMRDKSLRPKVITTLNDFFAVVVSYDLEEDLNEILFCFRLKKNMKKIKSYFATSCEKLNRYLKLHEKHDDVLKVYDYLKKLKIETEIQ